MILVGNQRGGAKNLAHHLMKDENERVKVHQIRGFASDDLQSAFQESYAMSRATKCKQHLFSLSLNPPKDTEISAKEFENTVDRAEQQLGLEGQPRAIVLHTKNGRTHAHAVWSRIDHQEMRAVQMSFSRRKMQDLSREHGWQMPRGFVRHEERDPRNFTLAEWQQCKRAGRDPTKTKEIFQDAWAISDSRTAFGNALEAHGFVLAKGDRRGHIAVDRNGEAFAIAKYVGVKAKQVRDRLGDPSKLPSKNEAHRIASDRTIKRLAELREQEKLRARQRVEQLSRQNAENKKRQSLAQEELKKRVASDTDKRKQEQDARLRKGLMGLLDRVTGKRKKTLQQNDLENAQAEQRVNAQHERLRAQYVSAQEAIAKRKKEELTRGAYIRRELANDTRQLEERFKELSSESDKPARRRQSLPRQKRRIRSTERPSFER
ncbi:relaxase/mobilization nuclease domain-containing protein [Roseobacter litoralis]|uniref:Relaxase/mobilization nuclease-like protein n=1 Tax=Roseobacter litoralis (strain ATCC 49566 / DSM 6996 / JCM 21268 / NBRC 15278 / OCh 149) TaxID=391595 RepID=F7ZBR4_ROSLO|nr:relaxase/mobilization nuclease-like protein [Roseobacter litoralis]AEI93106.1 relaxase/mobilization nuclease-like protein [Roseobacter litoralis Och 149]